MPVVITGDIISSSKLPLIHRQQRINDLFKGLFSTLRGVWGQSQQLRFEAIQGDAFQVYLPDDKDALRAALLLKCYCLAQDKIDEMYRFDCRLSIAVGPVSLLHPVLLAKSGGLVFDSSGRGLKGISPTSSQLVFASTEATWTLAINMGLALADEIIGRYTPAQSQAVLLKIMYPQQLQEWLANQLSISRSAYSQRLKQAGWIALETLLSFYAATTPLQPHDTN